MRAGWKAARVARRHNTGSVLALLRHEHLQHRAAGVSAIPLTEDEMRRRTPVAVSIAPATAPTVSYDQSSAHGEASRSFICEYTDCTAVSDLQFLFEREL